ncbi:unnamed protein product [Porites evermanni]|uniref:Acid trehalase-like protein 1 n=1 Tax=Porites evermanni TaxID=104178 RepID=A0ABN8LLE0_9CNID|nr:unnamed protein product [Porites evermanni]
MSICHAITLPLFLASTAVIRCIMAAGTSTRFITDTLPKDHNRVTVRQSSNRTLMPSVANGYVGTVIYSDAVHVSGVYNGKAYPKKKPIYPVYFYQHTHRARIPSTASIDFSLSGIQGKTSYALDVLEGVFYKWFSADSLNVEQRIYAHRSRKNLLVVEISAKNNAAKELLMKVSSNFGDSSVDVEFKTIDSNRPEALAAIGMVNETEEAGSMRANIATVWTKLQKTLTVKATSEEQTWYFITSIATSLDTKFNPLAEALYQWDAAMLENFLKNQRQLGRHFGERAGKEGEVAWKGTDWPYGLSPGGLPGGEEYMGHTFWDQDIWMYPPLVLLHPDLARSALKYRKDRLPAARRIAKEYGYKGAMFPWESSYTGLETSPGERYGKAQIHITGDIAFAAKQFWRSSKDFNWLREIGYPLVFQTAEYWASRVEYDVANDRYVINDVMPPDEYHYPVNNSVYTNVVAKMNLLFAKEVAGILGKEVPKEWLKIAEKLTIPFDGKNNYHPEYEGYTLDKEVKQADAILIGYPLMYEMDRKVRYNDLNLYENRTDPDGPAMTHSMFAIGWLDLGEKQRAKKPFLKNYANIRGPFKVWTERRDVWGAVNFITGAGGFLQAVIYGYGGFRLKDSELSFNPTLPPNVNKMRIRVNYLGSLIDFAIKDEKITIMVVSSGPIAPSLEVSTSEGIFSLERGKAVSISRDRGVLRIADSKSHIRSCAPCDHSRLHICLLLLLSFFLYLYQVICGSEILVFISFSLISLVKSSSAAGTPTRFVTDKLPRDFSRSSVRHSRNGQFMASVGNGYLGTVIYSDTVHISGVFNGPSYPKKYPIYPVYFYQHTHRARVPSTASVNFKVRGIPGNSSYALDVSEGVFYKWFKAVNLTVEERIYAHRTRKNLLVVEITAKNDAGRKFAMDIIPNLGHVTDDIHFYMKDSFRGDALAATGLINQTEETGSIRPNVAIVWTYPDPDNPLIIKNSSEEQTWYYITSIATNLDTKFNPLTEALFQFDEATRAKEKLLAEHKAAWKALWETGRIEIEGDLEMAQAVYGSMYYILSSTRSDWPYGLSPGGLPGGEEYMGHTFWDQDIWMYPPLVLLHPDLARSALKYRKDRLPAARRIAKKYGFKGAMFPWESSFTGLETSPGEKYGKNQNHITGDVAFAAKLFWEATKDLHWLRAVGYPLAYQTAEYWASRVDYDAKQDKYVINHVMPPDEYHYPVNNSLYTNVVAKINLLFAQEAADILGEEVPELWSTIAEKMYIPFDSKRNFHPEYEGYIPTVMVKQADVVLAGYPLMYEMQKQVRHNDLDYYERLTNPNGPAMTHAMFAIGWLEVGEIKKADRSFLKNYDNIQGPFKVWSERRWGKGAVNFITGAGGFLQAVVYGYGGIRIKKDGLYFNSTLPPGVTKLTIGIHYLESAIDFQVTLGGVSFTVVSNGPISPDLEVLADERVYPLKRGKLVRIIGTKSGIVRKRVSRNNT